MRSAPAVIPFYGEGAGCLFTIYCDVMHACGNRPTHDPHVTHDPPRRAFNAGHGEAQRTKSTAVKSAPPARAPFWAWPNNASRLLVAKDRGILSVYKSRGSPFDPFTCARAVRAALYDHS